MYIKSLSELLPNICQYLCYIVASLQSILSETKSPRDLYIKSCNNVRLLHTRNRIGKITDDGPEMHSSFSDSDASKSNSNP